MESSVLENEDVVLTIDSREQRMIAYCTKQMIPIKTASLDVGDILLTTSNENLVFERKTVADLVASINDGRYREQKQRLKSTYPFHRITYIIEGKLTKDKSLMSAIISSSYRDGFHLIHTDNMVETVWYITEIQERMKKGKTVFNTENGDYASSLKAKTKKSANLTPEMVYMMQLAQIPGISMKIAQDIATIYPSMSVLLKAIESGEKFDIKGMGKMKIKKMIEFIK
jgi:ERCC4-type nuclease